MKYLALSLLFLLPGISFAATAQETRQSLINQLIILIEQEITYLQSQLQDTPTVSTGNAVDNTVQIHEFTQQLTNQTMQTELIVHDDTANYDQFKDNQKMKCYNVFIKENGAFIKDQPDTTDHPINFYVNDELITTYYLTGIATYTFDGVNTVGEPGVGAFCHELNPGDTLKITGAGQEHVINI